jgi:hypothetical protein
MNEKRNSMVSLLGGISIGSLVPILGFDVGPTTISLGGGRPIRITRIDANTWTMLGSQ